MPVIYTYKFKCDTCDYEIETTDKDDLRQYINEIRLSLLLFDVDLQSVHTDKSKILEVCDACSKVKFKEIIDSLPIKTKG